MSPAASYFVRETAWDAPRVSACCLFSASPHDGLHTENGQIHLFVRESRGAWEKGTDLTLALAAVWVDKV